VKKGGEGKIFHWAKEERPSFRNVTINETLFPCNQGGEREGDNRGGSIKGPEHRGGGSKEGRDSNAWLRGRGRKHFKDENVREGKTIGRKDLPGSPIILQQGGPAKRGGRKEGKRSLLSKKPQECLLHQGRISSGKRRATEDLRSQNSSN